MKAGTRVQGASGAEIVVVKPPASGVEFRSGGAVAVGKRHTCHTCDAQVLVTKSGPGGLVCCGDPMVPAAAKTLPSSD